MLNEIATTRPQPLFTPMQMGKLQLPNRIIMAPLTRMRAANPGHVPSELHVEYYAQRASVLSSANAPRSARLLTVGLTPLGYGAPNKFGDGEQ